MLRDDSPPKIERWKAQWAWNKKRLDVLVKHYGKDFFDGAKVLDLGCGHGFFGYGLSVLGADVTYCDARQMHLDEIKYRDPHSKTICMNLEESFPDGKWDLIVHFGVLYHIENVEQNLISACKSAKHIALETEVTDGEHPACHIFKEDSENFSQSFGGNGSRPTPSFIERILSENDMTYELLKTNECDESIHKYNWKTNNNGIHPPGQRRMWFVRKNK